MSHALAELSAGDAFLASNRVRVPCNPGGLPTLPYRFYMPPVLSLHKVVEPLVHHQGPREFVYTGCLGRRCDAGVGVPTRRYTGA